MGWIWQPKAEHHCTPPGGRGINTRPIRSLWQCEVCEAFWEVTSFVGGDSVTRKAMRAINAASAQQRMGGEGRGGRLED